jgi:octaprenyl-diphosphate synthase
MHATNMNTLRAIQSLVRDELEDLETKLQHTLHSDVLLIREVCENLKEVSGKHVRPTVLFLTARSVGNSEKHMVTAGLAIELIHTATLIHDDVIDNHMIRRGKPTVYSVWGHNVATIMGDFLYSKAFAILGESGLFEVMTLLSRVTHIMSVGEMMQFQQRKNINVSEDGYLDIIHKKTASLFSAACECGASLSENGNGSRAICSGFGENIGLAFQITDDLFDYLAVDEAIGKPVASDFTDGKVTLPFITAFRNAPEKVRRRVQNIFRVGFENQSDWNEVVLFVQDYGGIEYSLEKAKVYGERAKIFLEKIAPSPERDALHLAADYVVNRVAPFSG